MNYWYLLLKELGLENIFTNSNGVKDLPRLRVSYTINSDQNKINNHSKIFMLKNYLKYYFKVLVSKSTNLMCKCLLLLVRKSKIFYNNYRFIPDYMLKFIRFSSSVLGLHVLRKTFDSMAESDGFVNWLVSIIRSIVYGVSMGSYVAYSTVSKTVWGTERAVQDALDNTRMAQITNYTTGNVVKEYVISSLFGVCLTLLSALVVTVGLEYVYTVYLSAPLPPIKDVPYVDKYCNPLVWKSCVSENIYPGMGFPFVGDELSKCLDLCSDQSNKGVWKVPKS
jgi:hypothetical protein